MELKTHPSLVEGIGAVIIILFVLCLMPVSCEQYSPTIVGPEVVQGITQETLPYFDSLIEVEETMQK